MAVIPVHIDAAGNANPEHAKVHRSTGDTVLWTCTQDFTIKYTGGPHPPNPTTVPVGSGFQANSGAFSSNGTVVYTISMDGKATDPDIEVQT